MNTVSTISIDLKCKNGTFGIFGRGLWIFEKKFHHRFYKRGYQTKEQDILKPTTGNAGSVR